MVQTLYDLRDAAVPPFPIPGEPADFSSSALVTTSVLVADPDPVLRRSVVQVLHRNEFQVLAESESATEAWSLVRKLQPGIVILGQAGIGRSVLEVARNIHSQAGAGVILLSPIPHLDWVKQVRAAGVDALLGRPPREADLVAALEMTRGRRDEVRRLRDELDGLRERVETASLVQKAKEVLMRRDGVSDSEAYQRLRRQADRSGRPLKQIAEAVLLASRVASVTAR